MGRRALSGLALAVVTVAWPPSHAQGADFDVPFPIWLDETGETPTLFGVRGHPSTLLINREGRIVGRVLGERDWTSVDARRLVEWLLAEDRAGRGP